MKSSVMLVLTHSVVKATAVSLIHGISNVLGNVNVTVCSPLVGLIMLMLLTYVKTGFVEKSVEFDP